MITKNYYGTFYNDDDSGFYNREDGPAIEWENGSKEWFKNGLLHREYGPAIEREDGSKFWYKNGLKHRDNGPAIEYSNGNRYWYKNGKQHRENGPAVYSVNTDLIVYNYKEFWLDDKKYSEEKYYRVKKILFLI